MAAYGGVLRWVCGLVLVLGLGCGDDASSVDDGDGGPIPDSGPPGDGSAPQDAGTDTGRGDADTPPDAASDGGAPQLDYTPPDLEGRVVVSHYLGDYDLLVYDTQSLYLVADRSMTDPLGDVKPILGEGVIAATWESMDRDELEVVDAETLESVAGSPFATAHVPVGIAYDAHRSRLYVYCIGTVGNPEESLLTVYDTSSSPWQEVPGSPLDIDVPAVEIAVDPVTGHLYGISLGTVWAVRIKATGVEHLGDSPIALEQTGSSLAIDAVRRRIYFTERRVPGPQRLYARHLDDFTEVEGSPLEFAGDFAGDVAVHEGTGDIFMIAAQSPSLHSASAEPFAMRQACGSADGCTIPPTETGLALDHERDRLFIAHFDNPEGPGFLTAWDVSDPAAPSEITEADTRPATAFYPYRLGIF